MWLNLERDPRNMAKDRDLLLEEARSMPFRELPDKYSVTGIHYGILKKGKLGAVYASDDGRYYEVFKIKISKPNVVMGSPVPERERIPSNNDFGVWAWCKTSKESALELFEQIESGKKEDVE